MKSLLVSAAMLLSWNAFADKDVCKEFFTCGTYTMKWKTSAGEKALTTVTIEATGVNTARFQYMTSVNGSKPDGWDLAVKFEDNGSFQMTWDEREPNYANGICSNNICTYGMHPWIPKGATEPIGNAGMIRFNGNKLEYVLMAGIPKKNHQSLQIFTKQ